MPHSPAAAAERPLRVPHFATMFHTRRRRGRGLSCYAAGFLLGMDLDGQGDRGGSDDLNTRNM
jgi:hypothetical protein